MKNNNMKNGQYGIWVVVHCYRPNSSGLIEHWLTENEASLNGIKDEVGENLAIFDGIEQAKSWIKMADNQPYLLHSSEYKRPTYLPVSR